MSYDDGGGFRITAVMACGSKENPPTPLFPSFRDSWEVGGPRPFPDAACHHGRRAKRRRPLQDEGGSRIRFRVRFHHTTGCGWRDMDWGETRRTGEAGPRSGPSLLASARLRSLQTSPTGDGTPSKPEDEGAPPPVPIAYHTMRIAGYGCRLSTWGEDRNGGDDGDGEGSGRPGGGKG